jgi:hypothetical protein
MAIGTKQVKILAGEEFSEAVGLSWESNLGLAYVATSSSVSDGTRLELHGQLKNQDIWLPFYDEGQNRNASMILLSNKIVPCLPYVEGRGVKALKFKVTQVQANDVAIEIGFVRF